MVDSRVKRQKMTETIAISGTPIFNPCLIETRRMVCPVCKTEWGWLDYKSDWVCGECHVDLEEVDD